MSDSVGILRKFFGSTTKEGRGEGVARWRDGLFLRMRCRTPSPRGCERGKCVGTRAGSGVVVMMGNLHPLH